MGAWNHLSHAVHVKPVKTPLLHSMVGVDADGYGHSLARTYTLTTHTQHKHPHSKQGNSQPTLHTHNSLITQTHTARGTLVAGV